MTQQNDPNVPGRLNSDTLLPSEGVPVTDEPKTEGGAASGTGIGAAELEGDTSSTSVTEVG